jgi:ATP synthase protein I
MSERKHDAGSSPTEKFAEQVAHKAERKLKAQRRRHRGIWLGLSMMGLVGWSVAIPTLAGTALGVYLDKHYPGAHSYTLALLVAGLIIGCFNAWHWGSAEMHDIGEDDDDGK